MPAATTIAPGDVVKKGNLVGIAVSGSSTEGEVIALNLEGAYELYKKASLAITQGDTLYWDETNEEITKTAADGFIIGHAYSAAAGSDTTCVVLLGGGGEGAVPNQAATVAAVSTAAASDLATAQALANQLKTTVNVILVALKDADIMASA